MYHIGQGAAGDDDESAKWYHRAADQGHAPSQFGLGIMYDTGRGMVQDLAAGRGARAALMLTYRLDTNIRIYVMKNYPPNLLEKFNALVEQLCISSITLGDLHYGAEKSARHVDNLTAIQHFVARLDVLAFEAKAAAHYGQVRAELERAGAPCGPLQIGGHTRSEG